MTRQVRISPDFTVGDRSKLRNAKTFDWSKAAEVLRNRIEDRFLDAADLMEGAGSRCKPERFGFAILAIDFAVAETIQAFRNGIKSHNGKS